MTAVYLVDANMVSELARGVPDPGVIQFMSSAGNLLVSTILFHELAFGLANAPPEQAPKVLSFITGLRQRFGKRAIGVDVPIAELAGKFRASEKRQGRVLAVSNALIAATASVHGAALVTRNEKDFQGLEVALVNPFVS